MRGIDRGEYVHQRKRRYMAQILEEFERTIESHVPPEEAQSFKAMVRRKVNALAVDAADVIRLDQENMVLNGHAQSVKDGLFPDGRPPSRGATTR